MEKLSSYWKQGKKLQRKGWNGKGMWLAYMPSFDLDEVNERTQKFIGKRGMHCDEYIAMWTAKGTWQPGWLASQADMLSEDWQVVD